jgi:hypothetical protein
LHSPSCFTSGLNGWQKEPNQNSNDCNNNEQFNECREIKSKKTSLSIVNGISLRVKVVFGFASFFSTEGVGWSLE